MLIVFHPRGEDPRTGPARLGDRRPDFAVVGDGVLISTGASIENAVVVRAELVRGSEPPPKALKGELHGENFVVSLAQ